MDQATAYGEAGTVLLNGETLMLAKLRGKDFGAMQAWVKEQLRHPAAIVKDILDVMRPTTPEPTEPILTAMFPGKNLQILTPEQKTKWLQAQNEYKKAMSAWTREQIEFQQNRELLLLDAKDDMANPNSIDKRAAESIFSSIPGMCYMLWLSISKRRPDITYEYVLENIERLEINEIQDKIKAIQQVDPALLEELEAKKSQRGADRPTPRKKR